MRTDSLPVHVPFWNASHEVQANARNPTVLVMDSAKYSTARPISHPVGQFASYSSELPHVTTKDLNLDEFKTFTEFISKLN